MQLLLLLSSLSSSICASLIVNVVVCTYTYIAPDLFCLVRFAHNRSPRIYSAPKQTKTNCMLPTCPDRTAPSICAPLRYCIQQKLYLGLMFCCVTYLQHFVQCNSFVVDAVVAFARVHTQPSPLCRVGSAKSAISVAGAA